MGVGVGAKKKRKKSKGESGEGAVCALVLGSILRLEGLFGFAFVS